MQSQGILLPESMYANPDVVKISQMLLGKVLCSTIGGRLTAGIITETEAYSGRNDKACHANNGLKTARNEVMYGKPGRAYIYLCYGIHHLLNVVTNSEGMADAVLIRGIYPVEGLDVMLERRKSKSTRNLTNGPGKLSQALGITTSLNKASLSEPPLWIEDREISIHPGNIRHSKRIGVEYAGEDANRLWRFFIPADSL
jgi:DNA-3-methyladenine glycosylase